MSKYTTPIPTGVFVKLPACLANHRGQAFDVRIQGFRGDDDTQMFAVDVYTDPSVVTPSDRRRSASTEATQTTYFFDAMGAFSGEPQTIRTRYMGA